jgi:AcrR family transcriptional regulator
MPDTEDATNVPAPKRRVRNTTATRAAILEAARTLLAKDGPDGVSLSEVAKLAGVNRGTAYQHFATREAVIEAAVAEVSARSTWAR